MARHQAVLALLDGVHGHAGEGGGHHAVHEIGAAGAQIVSQVADDGLFARGGLDLVAQVFGHAHLLAMPEGVRLAVFLDLVAFPLGALGEDRQRVVAGVVLLVVDQQPISFCRSTLYSGMQQRTEVT